VACEFAVECTALPTEESLMLAEYTGVLVILAVATLFAAGILLLHWLAGPRRRFAAKQQPFDCGEPSGASPPPQAESVSSPPPQAESVSSPTGRQAVKFHLVAILFVVFLVEAVFFYLWAAVFWETGEAGLVAITVFSLPLVVGLVYEWAKGVLEW
jgi:NADH-quinone oxidoreductase subunit A